MAKTWASAGYPRHRSDRHDGGSWSSTSSARVVFSVFGFLYVKNRGKKTPSSVGSCSRRKSADRDYLRLVIDGWSAADAKAKAGGANADDSANNASAAGTDSADAAGAKPAMPTPARLSPPSPEYALQHFRSVETVVPGDRHVLL